MSAEPLAPTPSPPPTDRVRLRRKRERGSYEREAVEAILDEALVAHLGIVDPEGQPIVVPTLHARCGEFVYVHGSPAARSLRSLAQGAPACLTVTLLDGLVLARSAMHHSANYRSAVILGQARAVTDPALKLAALEAVVEHIVPGRWSEVRPPTEQEMKATAVLEMNLQEASAKVRTGPPLDDEEDYALTAWAGVIPISMQSAAPLPDPRLDASIELPARLARYSRP